MECLFCAIANKVREAEIVYEDDHVVGILDVFPRTPGHTMIIPKIHAETILDLPEKELEPVFAAVRKVTATLQKALGPDGFTIGINHGKVAGQAIDHLHIHIMPRWRDDGGGSLHSVVGNPPKESLKVIKDRILNV
ncbi:MAG: Histidine triad protein [Candidatus Wolfebacteria bacterium GW2011_GWE1_48_7]|uniref:Histidine triad protein n=2 Tax=Candidatus Wolfeibacteriota TaxID=1752735 RepID=A0A0G1U649_9BACT|nr:MAG: histidine triad (HIT) protein, Hit-like protein involved in cell-cycle regulation [Candidatus Wolfebacteria bacterium GW2011_GWB1_47_1]KKU36416.1 MAG: Histidine triad protein [Candidatus Wolfebacteria bacterium GW2011_GWC2_46_275]KKU41729.1 MAG: Histidine triad protein [Candidatus Wolfebacteria bacterium GW2011_GWB2_46_69]KKU53977.1 MAG: Histidine triad protein [Candidatus Wolfebacteria bacterium GW2011_GWC1_47_103]KKU59020.1 MAG: Histidine triad protein [Candidatus Wolfebacteria bacter